MLEYFDFKKTRVMDFWITVYFASCLKITTDMCPDGLPDNTSCFAFSDHVNSSCVSAVLKCEPIKCVAHIRDAPAVCIFNEFQDMTIEESITCCPCNSSDVFPHPWWDCNTPSSSEYNTHQRANMTTEQWKQ